MALSNENNPRLVTIPLGSLAADGSVPAIYLKQKATLLSAAIINGAAIAASDTDYAAIGLHTSGDVEVAELDTRAAHENGLAAFVGKEMNLVDGQEELAAGTSLKVVYDETDSGTAIALTDAVLVLELAR